MVKISIGERLMNMLVICNVAGRVQNIVHAVMDQLDWHEIVELEI